MQISTIFNRQNIGYTILFVVTFIIIVTNRIIHGFTSIVWLTDFASITAILGAIFLAKHSIFGAVFYGISTLFTIPVSLVQHIWFNSIINIIIVVPSWIIAIINWHKSNKSQNTFIHTLSPKQATTTILLIIPTIALLTYVLFLLNGNLFYLDAPYSTLCALGTILATFALIEQFYLYSTANAIGIVMYILLTIQNPNNFSLILVCFIQLIINIVAIINWRKILKNKQNQTQIIDKQPKKD